MNEGTIFGIGGNIKEAKTSSSTFADGKPRNPENGQYGGKKSVNNIANPKPFIRYEVDLNIGEYNFGTIKLEVGYSNFSFSAGKHSQDLSVNKINKPISELSKETKLFSPELIEGLKKSLSNINCNIDEIIVKEAAIEGPGAGFGLNLGQRIGAKANAQVGALRFLLDTPAGELMVKLKRGYGIGAEFGTAFTRDGRFGTQKEKKVSFGSWEVSLTDRQVAAANSGIDSDQLNKQVSTFLAPQIRAQNFVKQQEKKAPAPTASKSARPKVSTSIATQPKPPRQGINQEQTALLDQTVEEMASHFSNDGEVILLYQTYQKSGNRAQGFATFQRSLGEHLQREERANEWVAVGTSASVFLSQVAILTHNKDLGRFAVGIGALTQAFSGMRELSNVSKLISASSSGLSLATTAGLLGGAGLVLGGFAAFASFMDDDDDELGEALAEIHSAVTGMWTEMRESFQATWQMLGVMDQKLNVIDSKLNVINKQLHVVNEKLDVMEVNNQKRFFALFDQINAVHRSLSNSLNQKFYHQEVQINQLKTTITSYLDYVVDGPLKSILSMIRKSTMEEILEKLRKYSTELAKWLLDAAALPARTGELAVLHGTMQVDLHTLITMLQEALAPENFTNMNLKLGLLKSLLMQQLPQTLQKTKLVNPQDWFKVLDIYLQLMTAAAKTILEKDKDIHEAYWEEISEIAKVASAMQQFMEWIVYSPDLWNQLKSNYQNQFDILRSELSVQPIVGININNEHSQTFRWNLLEDVTTNILRIAKESSMINSCFPYHNKKNWTDEQRFSRTVEYIFNYLHDVVYIEQYRRSYAQYLTNLKENFKKGTPGHRKWEDIEKYEKNSKEDILKKLKERRISVLGFDSETLHSEATLIFKDFSDEELDVFIKHRYDRYKFYHNKEPDYINSCISQFEELIFNKIRSYYWKHLNQNEIINNQHIAYLKFALLIKLIDPEFKPNSIPNAIKQLQGTLSQIGSGNYRYFHQASERTLGAKRHFSHGELKSMVWQEELWSYMGDNLTQFSIDDLQTRLKERLLVNPFYQILQEANAHIKAVQEILDPDLNQNDLERKIERADLQNLEQEHVLKTVVQNLTAPLTLLATLIPDAYLQVRLQELHALQNEVGIRLINNQIKNAIDLSVQNNSPPFMGNETSLHRLCAAVNSNIHDIEVELKRLAIDNQLDTILNSSDLTTRPLYLAMQNRRQDLIALLLEYGAKVESGWLKEPGFSCDENTRKIIALLHFHYYIEQQSLEAKFDIRTTFNLIKNAIKNLSAYQNIEDAVIFIGKTGVGKSTLINSLLGVEYELIRKGGRKYLQAKAGMKEQAKTSSLTQSETIYPQILTSEDAMSFVDMPGFQDTRNMPWEIAGGLSAQMLSYSLSSIRLLTLVCVESDLYDAKVEGIRESFENLGKIIDERADLIPNVLFIVNKVDPDITANDIIERIQEILADPNFSNKAKYVLQKLTVEHIVLATRPDQKFRQQLFDKIESGQSVMFSKFNFTCYHKEAEKFKTLLARLAQYQQHIKEEMQSLIAAIIPVEQEKLIEQLNLLTSSCFDLRQEIFIGPQALREKYATLQQALSEKRQLRDGLINILDELIDYLESYSNASLSAILVDSDMRQEALDRGARLAVVDAFFSDIKIIIDHLKLKGRVSIETMIEQASDDNFASLKDEKKEAVIASAPVPHLPFLQAANNHHKTKESAASKER